MRICILFYVFSLRKNLVKYLLHVQIVCSIARIIFATCCGTSSFFRSADKLAFVLSSCAYLLYRLSASAQTLCRTRDIQKFRCLYQAQGIKLRLLSRKLSRTRQALCAATFQYRHTQHIPRLIRLWKEE